MLTRPLPKMKRSEKLDKILDGLLYTDTLRLQNKPVSKAVTIEWLTESLELECEVWEMKSLQQELADKGFIEVMDGELHITEKGKHFKVREKGFKKLEKVDAQEDVIREKTIEKFKYDKFSFWISVIAIVIAGLSLILTVTMQ